MTVTKKDFLILNRTFRPLFRHQYGSIPDFLICIRTFGPSDTVKNRFFDLLTVSRHEKYGSEQHFPELDP